MGILTHLRNAFGRSRKGRATEAEGADRTPSQSPEPTVPAPSHEPGPTPASQLPEPRTETPDEHELVAAAFDKVTVPKPTRSPEPTGGEAEVEATEAEAAA